MPMESMIEDGLGVHSTYVSLFKHGHRHVPIFYFLYHDNFITSYHGYVQYVV